MKRVVGVMSVAALLAAASGGLAGNDVSAERGARLFFVHGCYGCHTVGAVGTPINPDLTHIGARYSAARLARWLADPERERPGAHMPPLELSDAEIEALAAYLADLRGA